MKYLKGEIAPRMLRVNLFLAVVLYGSLILISIAVFPGGYNLTEYTISSLGNPHVNTFPGWLFFSIAFWVLTIMLLPFFRFVHSKLKKYTPKFAQCFLISSIIVDIGLILLGFFPEFPPTIFFHMIATMMSFGGFFVAAIFSWFGLYFLGKGSEGARKTFVFASLIVMVTTFGGSLLMGCISYLINQMGLLEGTILSNVFIWEWCLFFAVGLYIILLEIIISREK
ncbi:MAG: hypothetical protein ACFFCS_11155 [Candidatus Hodarchaeota archaeon]